MTEPPLQFLLDFSVLARYPRIRWGRMYRLAVRHKSNGAVAVLAWTHASFCFRHIPIIALLEEKRNILFNNRYIFRPHVAASTDFEKSF